ncbi:unnamed protein product [Caenorhabditis sp. 36 PRJEB53466]|nr:unnamed protein product [Caenorhabditis sp. 36 PRJEB53466]
MHYIMKKQSGNGHLLPLLFFCFALLQPSCFIVNAARILVYCPSISKSHILLCSKYADLLHNATHDTVLFIPSYFNSLDDFDGAKHAKIWRLRNITHAYDRKMSGFFNVMDVSHIGFLDRMTMEVDFWMEMCEDMVKQRHRMQNIVDYGFDIAIYNDIDPCNAAIVRSLNIPKTVLLSSEPIMDKIAWDLGLPSLPSYVPSVEENPNHDRMGFFDRMSNAYKHFQSIVVHYLQDRAIQNIFREKVSPDFPSIIQIVRNCSVMFVNTDEMFDIARPISSKVVYVGMLGGGNHAKNVLSEELDSIFKKGKKGSVFVSFGTVAPFKILPERIQQSLFNAIESLPDYHFVLKVASDDKTTAQMFANVPNTDLVDWVPQNAVLQHKNLKLFVSHGGMNSVLETMYYGVPMIIMPVFTDQFRNAKNVERRGAGKMIARETVIRDTFFNEISEVLKDPSYHTSAQRISKLIQNHPFTPEERVLKWIDFVTEYDTSSHFDLESNNLTIVETYHLDILFYFFLIPLVTLFIYKRLFAQKF